MSGDKTDGQQDEAKSHRLDYSIIFCEPLKSVNLPVSDQSRGCSSGRGFTFSGSRMIFDMLQVAYRVLTTSSMPCSVLALAPHCP